MRSASSRQAFRALLLVFIVLGSMGFRPIRSIRRPLELRVEGFFDNPAEEAKAWRVLPVEVGRGTMRRLALLDLRVLTSGPLAGSVVDEIKQYRPSLRFTGDAELVAKLSAATPQQRVQVLGHLSAARYFLVASVEVADSTESSTEPSSAPASASPSPASAPSPSAPSP